MHQKLSGHFVSKPFEVRMMKILLNEPTIRVNANAGALQMISLCTSLCMYVCRCVYIHDIPYIYMYIYVHNLNNCIFVFEESR